MPYEAEHACRLMYPDQFEQFRSKDSGRARLILGKRKGSGEWEVQAIRYPKGTWSEEAAKQSCQAHDGMFEAAVKVAEHSSGAPVQEWDEAKDGPLPEAAVKAFGVLEHQERQARGYARRLRGVEVFSVGKWNGDVYTEADLDDMVRAFYTLGPGGSGEVAPPLKLGHAEAQRFFGQADGAPALGWIEAPRREGKKLVADFADVPDLLHELIRSKKYRKVSAEVYWNFADSSGRIFPRVLKAVSLLGADLPAVSNLKDLQAALMGDKGRDVRVHGRSGADVRTYELESAGSNDGKGGSDMEQREYQERLDALNAKLEAAQRQCSDWETRALRAEATLAQRDEEFAVRQFKEVTLPGLKKDGKVLPAEEETLLVMFSSLAPGTKKYAGVDVNPREMFVQSLKDRKPVVDLRARGAGGESGDDLIAEGETPATAVDRLIRKFVDSKEAKSYAEGKELVKTRHPQLWGRYISG